MDEGNTAAAWGLALAAGLALWGATAMLAGRAEPWDSTLYWTASYPLALLLAGLFGFVFPGRPWRRAQALVLTQAPVMLAGGAGLGLLPLGLVLLGLLALPAVVTAAIGGRLARRRGRG